MLSCTQRVNQGRITKGSLWISAPSLLAWNLSDLAPNQGCLLNLAEICRSGTGTTFNLIRVITRKRPSSPSLAPSAHSFRFRARSRKWRWLFPPRPLVLLPFSSSFLSLPRRGNKSFSRLFPVSTSPKTEKIKRRKEACELRRRGAPRQLQSVAAGDHP